MDPQVVRDAVGRRDRLRELEVRAEEDGPLAEAALPAFLSQEYGIPVFDISSAVIDESLVSLFSRELAQSHTAIPVGRSGGWLIVAMPGPAETAVISALEEASGLSVRAVLAIRSEILASIEKYYNPR